jgi:hypothetical protein
MLFYTYPIELINQLQSKGADMDVGEGPKGTFKLNIRSHFREAKSIMNNQKWVKTGAMKLSVWKI